MNESNSVSTGSSHATNPNTKRDESCCDIDISIKCQGDVNIYKL